MNLNWTQNGHETDSKLTQNELKMDPNWTKMDIKWLQNLPQITKITDYRV